jgi:hypothetical protein
MDEEAMEEEQHVPLVNCRKVKPPEAVTICSSNGIGLASDE